MVTELELLFHLLFFIMLGRKDRIGLLQYQGKTVPVTCWDGVGSWRQVMLMNFYETCENTQSIYHHFRKGVLLFK